MLRVKTFTGQSGNSQNLAAAKAEEAVNTFLEENPAAIIYNGQLQTVGILVSLENYIYYEFTITALFNLPDPK